MDNLTDILVVVDNDMDYGIKHGFYDYQGVPSCEVISIDEFKSRNLIAPAPTLCGKDIYMRNPYTGSFLPITDTDIERKMSESKAFAIREALVMMGAKDIELVEDISDNTAQQINTGANVKANPIAQGEGKVEYSNNISLNLKSIIESHDPERKAHSIDKVQDFLKMHSLLDEDNLIMLTERFARDGKLAGTETVCITFCSEIKSALNILCSVNYKVFSSNFDFESQKSNIHTIKKTLTVNFG
ncbi:MAG: hypothetical protein IKL56_06180 [Bacteroidaceae bacterium]|nr:hypothetical protein [Bacteroidaceae bacterium]